MRTASRGDIQNAVATRKFPYRPGSKWTGDDLGTVFGICVSLLIVLAGALGYIICAGLLVTLLRDLNSLTGFLRLQTCPW